MTAIFRPPPGIQPDVLYPIDDAQEVSKLGHNSFRQMRRRGLRVKYHGSRAYVLGKDLIDHILEHGKDEK